MTTSTVQPSILHSLKQGIGVHKEKPDVISPLYGNSFNHPDIPPIGDIRNLPILELTKIPITSEMVERKNTSLTEFANQIGEVIKKREFFGLMQFSLDEKLQQKLETLLTKALQELHKNNNWKCLIEEQSDGFMLVRGAGITSTIHNKYCPEYAARFFMGDYFQRDIYNTFPEELVRAAAEVREFCRKIVELLCFGIDGSRVFPDISFVESSQIQTPEKNLKVYSNLIIHPSIPDNAIQDEDKPDDYIISNQTHTHNKENLFTTLFGFQGGGLVSFFRNEKQWYRIYDTQPGVLTLILDHFYLPPHGSFKTISEMRSGVAYFCEEIANYGRGLTSQQLQN